MFSKGFFLLFYQSKVFLRDMCGFVWICSRLEASDYVFGTNALSGSVSEGYISIKTIFYIKYKFQIRENI